jgi:hypothetical protein
MVYALVVNGRYLEAYENQANALKNRQDAINLGFTAELVTFPSIKAIKEHYNG